MEHPNSLPFACAHALTPVEDVATIAADLNGTISPYQALSAPAIVARSVATPGSVVVSSSTMRFDTAAASPDAIGSSANQLPAALPAHVTTAPVAEAEKFDAPT